MSETTERLVDFQGEVMLLNWGDTSTRGRTVTLQLDDLGEAHPFKHTRQKSGKTPGQRYMMVLVAIGDDERPVEKTPSQLAFLLCRDPQFWHFCQERSFDTIDNEDAARAYILTACGITSRSLLDRDTRARAHWDALIYRPWCEYRKNSLEAL
jgi:hypothetical protein